jgi:hypothetical protein
MLVSLAVTGGSRSADSDEVETTARSGVAGEERRGRQEELVDDLRIEQRAERVRPCLAQDPTMTASAERIDDRGAGETKRPAERHHLSAVGKPALEPARSAVARQNERPFAEDGMLGGDVTPAAEDRDLGRRGQAEAGAEVGVRIGSGRVDLLCAPGAPRRLAEDAGAD